MPHQTSILKIIFRSDQLDSRASLVFWNLNQKTQVLQWSMREHTTHTVIVSFI